MGLSVPAARRLLKAAASLRLLRALPNDRFALDDLGAAMIGNPAIAAFVAHHDLLYSDLRDPVALLRGEHETALSRFWPYAADRPGDANERRGAVGRRSLRRLQRVDVAHPGACRGNRPRRLSLRPASAPHGCRRRARAPFSPPPQSAPRRSSLRCSTFPPSPCARAERLGSLGLAGRVETIGGDMLRDPLPRGADVISLVRVLHDHDDESGEDDSRRDSRRPAARRRDRRRRADGGRARRGADGRRLFRLLPARDGPRASAHDGRDRPTLERCRI